VKTDKTIKYLVELLLVLFLFAQIGFSRPLAELNLPGNPAFAIRNDLAIDLETTIDLSAKKSKSMYTIRNLKNAQTRIELASPLFQDKNRIFDLKANDKQESAVESDLKVLSLSENTSYVEFRPYLKLKEKKQNILVTDYKLDIRVKLPANAKIIKSSIPLTYEGNTGIAAFKMDKIRAIPPVYVWYTTAAENITIEKKVLEGNSEVTVQISVKNLSSVPANNIELVTQFPADFYTVDTDRSEGSFQIQDKVMTKWKGKIGSLPGNGGKVISYVLIKNTPDFKHKDSEILLYNQKGDLIGSK
jgi:hypothetical protein